MTRENTTRDETMERRHGWGIRPRLREVRGETPTRVEIRQMMPEIPRSAEAMKETYKYFTNVHEEHHIACEVARNSVMVEHMDELVNFNWASFAEKRVLVYKMARKWRERVAEEFETRRERAAIDVCFEPNRPRARTFEEIAERVTSGVQRMFSRSTDTVVHPDLYSRIGGCLCWGTWATVLDPSVIPEWSKKVFPILRIFGAKVKVSGLLVSLASSTFKVKELLTVGQIRECFPPADYCHWGLLRDAQDDISPGALLVCHPIEIAGLKIRGLVWLNTSLCSRELSVNVDAHVALRKAASFIPAKIRETMETSGCEIEFANITRLCGNGAVIEHLRRECTHHGRKDVFARLFSTGDADAVDGFVWFNPSGRQGLNGHWAVGVPYDRDPARPPLLISTDMHHAISADFNLLDTDLSTIGLRETHVSRVLLGYISRTNIKRHGEQNTFVGTKWSHEERQSSLLPLAINAHTAARYLGKSLLPTANPARPMEEIEVLENLTPEAFNAKCEPVWRTMQRHNDERRWSPSDLTLAGTIDRAWRLDQRHEARLHRYRAGGPPELGLNPGCYLVFRAGNIFDSSKIPERAVIAAAENHVDLDGDTPFDVEDDEFSEDEDAPSESDESEAY